MAAGHHRRQLRVAPGAAGEDVADAVHADRAPGLLAPGDEQVTGLAVEVGQGQAADPALDRGAEPGQLHERLPQAVAVDVLMAGLQNVDGSVHGDLLRLFWLWSTRSCSS